MLKRALILRSRAIAVNFLKRMVLVRMAKSLLHMMGWSSTNSDTGTPAGDPIEARAIHEAFFGQDVAAVDPGDVLYVGSIKTVVGHTEGTAGIAALMKASLAIQHKVLYIAYSMLLLSPIG